MDEINYLDLPAIENLQEPDSYKYDTEYKPYRYTRLYKTVNNNDYGKDKAAGAENKSV